MATTRTVTGSLSPVNRIAAGAFGGLAAVCMKYIGQDHSYVTQMLDAATATNQAKVMSLAIGYAIILPILMFIGGLVGWATEESNRLKVLALGVAAPALITTWAGGTTSEIAQRNQANLGTTEQRLAFSPISTAFAGDRSFRVAQSPSVEQGLKLFFGVGKGDSRYWVIVGLHASEQEAKEQAARINAENQALKAFVGKRMPGNDKYPVIVGDFVPLTDAKLLQEKAKALRSVTDARLSDFPDRR